MSRAVAVSETPNNTNGFSRRSNLSPALSAAIVRSSMSAPEVDHHGLRPVEERGVACMPFAVYDTIAVTLIFSARLDCRPHCRGRLPKPRLRGICEDAI